jgi:hypothetical protein
VFEVYKTDLYKKSGHTFLETPIEDYNLLKKDISLKEIFTFDLDSSILKISAYPNKITDVKSFKIDNIIKTNDTITIKSKINLKNEGIVYDFITNFNINDDDSYIYLLLYDDIKDESTFINVTHYYFKK